MSSPFGGAAAITSAADNTTVVTIPIVERLPPVTGAVPRQTPSTTVMNDPGPPAGSGGSTLLMGRAFAQQIEDVGEEAPAIGTQSVAWTAIEAAQSTLSQGFYGGADYLLVRPHLSEPNAFLFGQGSNGQVTAATNTFDFNYQSSPRIFLGYRSPVTGSGVQFTYWHFEENAFSNFTASGQNSGFFPNLDIIWLLIGNNNNNNNNNNNGPDFGNSITAQMHLRLNVFDIDFFKPVALGNGRWLLTGSVGARIVDFSQSTTTLCYDNGSPSFSQYQTNAFTGAGPRLSGEARRNVGARGALYVRGGYGILLGGHSATYADYDIVNINSIAIRENLTRMVSVADIEFGGSWRASERWVLSAGYMFQFWTDMAGTGGVVSLSDNANVLAFDGLVVRASLQF